MNCKDCGHLYNSYIPPEFEMPEVLIGKKEDCFLNLDMDKKPCKEFKEKFVFKKE